MSRRESACQAKIKMAEWERVVDEGLDERVRVLSRTSQTKIFLRREQGGAGARLEAARYLSIQLDVQTQVQICRRRCRY